MAVSFYWDASTLVTPGQGIITSFFWGSQKHDQTWLSHMHKLQKVYDKLIQLGFGSTIFGSGNRGTSH